MMSDLASLVLRLAAGLMFIAHGLQKVFGLFGGPGIKGFSEMLAELGFAPALFWAYVASYTELIAGLFLALGIFPRSSSAALLALIIVATFKVHLAKGFFLSAGGFEYNLVITSVLLALLLLGAGKFALVKKF
ncbi:MAG: DoxX family protein [Candidatus Omnitrophota bacterium]